MSIDSVRLSNHLILYYPLFLLPSPFILQIFQILDFPECSLHTSHKLVIDNLEQQSSTFLAPGPSFVKDSYFMDGQRGWFQDDSSTLTFIGHLISLLLHQLHLRSSGIRSRRLGTPDLESWLDSGSFFSQQDNFIDNVVSFHQEVCDVSYCWCSGHISILY